METAIYIDLYIVLFISGTDLILVLVVVLLLVVVGATCSKSQRLLFYRAMLRRARL